MFRCLNIRSISENAFDLYSRDEQYRIMWNELETLVRAHVSNSEKHQRVLECLMACRSKPPEEEERKKRGRKREDREDKSEQAVKEHGPEKPRPDSDRWLVLFAGACACALLVALYLIRACPFFNCTSVTMSFFAVKRCKLLPLG